MIEKMARTMWEADPEGPAEWSNSAQFSYEMQARVALEALREPSNAMVTAGRVPPVVGHAMAYGVWQAMIDAALSEKEPDMTERMPDRPILPQEPTQEMLDAMWQAAYGEPAGIPAEDAYRALYDHLRSYGARRPPSV